MLYVAAPLLAACCRFWVACSRRGRRAEEIIRVMAVECVGAWRRQRMVEEEIGGGGDDWQVEKVQAVCLGEFALLQRQGRAGASRQTLA